MGLKLLLVEDNQDILENLYGYFEPLGYDLDSAEDGVTGLSLAVSNDYDAVVLDIALPGMNGLDVCRRLREDALKDTPLLLLTARDTVDDKLVGFAAGADDYIVKPFFMTELEARLRALHRRSTGRSARAVLKVGGLQLDPSTLEATREGRALTLTPIGLKILDCLMRQSPRVVARERLEREIWGEDLPESDALRTHIHALRQAVDKPFGRCLIHTVHGVGFRLADLDAASA